MIISGGYISGSRIDLYEGDGLFDVMGQDNIITLMKGGNVSGCIMENSVIYLPDGTQFGEYDPKKVGTGKWSVQTTQK